MSREQAARDDVPDAAAPPERACPVPGPTRAFEHAGIRESSGVARSFREPCVYWVHDDSGSGPVLYAMDGAGRHLAEAWLDAPAIDWEDIASFERDSRPWLLVADTGNNARDRASVTLLLFEEPVLPRDAAAANMTVRDVTTITVRFPATPFDIESMAVDPATDEILIVSKGAMAAPLVSSPSGPDQALYSAPLSRALSDRDVTLAFRTLIPGIRPGPGSDPVNEFGFGVGGGRTTAMDVSPASDEIAILTYREILVWTRATGASWSDTLQGVPRAIAVPDPGKTQMEGLAYTHDGRAFIVADERGDVNSEFTVVARDAPTPRASGQRGADHADVRTSY